MSSTPLSNEDITKPSPARQSAALELMSLFSANPNATLENDTPIRNNNNPNNNHHRNNDDGSPMDDDGYNQNLPYDYNQNYQHHNNNYPMYDNDSPFQSNYIRQTQPLHLQHHQQQQQPASSSSSSSSLKRRNSGNSGDIPVSKKRGRPASSKSSASKASAAARPSAVASQFPPIADNFQYNGNDDDGDNSNHANADNKDYSRKDKSLGLFARTSFLGTPLRSEGRREEDLKLGRSSPLMTPRKL
jgi:hypothetical protein